MSKRSSHENSTYESQFRDQNHMNSVLENIREFFETQKYSDVMLVAGQDEQRVSAHRIVLYASSPYLTALLTNEMAEATKQEITIQGVSGDSLRALLTFCYTGAIFIDEDNVDDIVGAASLLAMARVERLCEKYYLQKLCRSNCLGLWQLANQYEFGELKKSALAIALEEFVFVMEEEEFLLLQPGAFEMLLANDGLYVQSEELVFYALTRWIDHDVEERQTLFEKLFKLVRTNRIKSSFMLETVMPYFRKLGYLDLFANLMMTQSSLDSSGTATAAMEPRTWGENPLPVIIGRADSPTADHLIICQLSYLEKTWTPMIELPCGRYDYGLVQADQCLFIIGGKDRSNIPLGTVQRIDLRTWKFTDVKALLKPSSQLKCVHQNGVIYAFGVGDGPNLGFVQRYVVANDEWTLLPNINIGNVEVGSFDAVAIDNQIWIVHSRDEKTDISIFAPNMSNMYRRYCVNENLDQLCIHACESGLIITCRDKSTKKRKLFLYEYIRNRIHSRHPIPLGRLYENNKWMYSLSSKESALTTTFFSSPRAECWVDQLLNVLLHRRMDMTISSHKIPNLYTYPTELIFVLSECK